MSLREGLGVVFGSPKAWREAQRSVAKFLKFWYYWYFGDILDNLYVGLISTIFVGSF